MRQQGVALVVVLWLVALLSLMATSYVLGIRREASLAVYQVQDARLLAACEAGVHYAAYMIEFPDLNLRWRTDGEIYPWQWDGVELRIRAIDEAGKVDLNHANSKLLQAVLNLAGADETESETLADAILDWRDGDEQRRHYGAEAGDYVSAGLPYEPSNRPFRSIHELAMVLGMRPALFQALLPWVTIYNHRDGINPAVAPAELLGSLPGVDPQAVGVYLQSRRQLQGSGQSPASIPTVQGITFNTQSGQVFSILVQASAQGKTVSLQTVVRIRRGQLYYLDWREAVSNSLFGEAEEDKWAPE